jgi:hypothetical protein
MGPIQLAVTTRTTAMTAINAAMHASTTRRISFSFTAWIVGTRTKG